MASFAISATRSFKGEASQDVVDEEKDRQRNGVKQRGNLREAQAFTHWQAPRLRLRVPRHSQRRWGPRFCSIGALSTKIAASDATQNISEFIQNYSESFHVPDCLLMRPRVGSSQRVGQLAKGHHRGGPL